MLEAVVFDFDGVIVDSEEYHYRSIVQALSVHELALTFEKYRADFTGGGDRDTVSRICSSYGISFDDAQLQSWLVTKADLYRTLVSDGIRPLPGAVNLVHSVADKLPLGLATGSRRSDVEAVLAHIEGGRLIGRFSTIVTSDDVVNPKPYPDTYATAVEKLGFEADHCLAIEDTPGGIASAKGAGLRVLAVSGTHGQEKLSQADRIIPTLAGVSLGELKDWF